MIPQLLPCPSLPLYEPDVTPESCEICYDSPDRWQILPCTHKLCNQCYTKLQANSCPWCRSPLDTPNNRRTSRDVPDPGDLEIDFDLLTIIDIEFIQELPQGQFRRRGHRRRNRRPRGESDPGPHYSTLSDRHVLNTPEEVINYEQEAARRINARRKAANRERINAERDHPGNRRHQHGRRDVLSRRRSPVEAARNAATRNTRGMETYSISLL